MFDCSHSKVRATLASKIRIVDTSKSQQIWEGHLFSYILTPFATRPRVTSPEY
jgi:hypothetical protein